MYFPIRFHKMILDKSLGFNINEFQLIICFRIEYKRKSRGIVPFLPAEHKKFD